MQDLERKWGVKLTELDGANAIIIQVNIAFPLYQLFWLITDELQGIFLLTSSC